MYAVYDAHAEAKVVSPVVVKGSYSTASLLWPATGLLIPVPELTGPVTVQLLDVNEAVTNFGINAIRG